MAVSELSFLQQCFGREGGGFIKGIKEKGKLIPACTAACSVSELENNGSVMLHKMCISTAAWIKAEGSLTLRELREGKGLLSWLSIFQSLSSCTFHLQQFDAGFHNPCYGKAPGALLTPGHGRLCPSHFSGEGAHENGLERTQTIFSCWLISIGTGCTALSMGPTGEQTQVSKVASPVSSPGSPQSALVVQLQLMRHTGVPHVCL